MTSGKVETLMALGMNATLAIPGLELVLAELREIKTLLAKQRPEPVSRDDGRPWTVAETAEHLRVCESTLRKAIKAGRVHVAKTGRKLNISVDEVRRLESEGLE